MKIVIVLTVCLTAILADSIPACKPDDCKLPTCKCSENAKGYDGHSPQFLVLSFDDALPKPVYEEFIRPTFINRKNPDGCPISGTFFVPHEFTDYSIVNTLYRRGYEIGSHSISKHHLQSYWRNANLSVLQEELAGQRQVLSKFANIPQEDIIGARVPQLQFNPFTLEALAASKFTYDSSWPTLQNRTLTPYTLDYESIQVCHTINCQVKSTPGLWEIPINDWIDQEDENCNELEACAVTGSVDEVFEWMKINYNTIKDLGVPITFRPSLSFFTSEPNNPAALGKFLDYIGTLKNTFIVSNAQVLEWYKNPKDDFSSCQPNKKAPCSPITCVVPFNDDVVTMVACNSCPKKYPWVGNPLGE